MTDRERLIELMQTPITVTNGMTTVGEIKMSFTEAKFIADHLLANGVIVPPDHKNLFYTAEMMLEQWNETTGAIAPQTSWYYELLSILEDTVNLSFGAGILYKEETEQALKERESNA